jgi:hypothetical protein
MDWGSAFSNILDRYTGAGGGTASAPADVHNDYAQIAQAAPADATAGGLSQAFRSDQTPPFPEMVANLFGHSDPNQRAGLLNRLLGALGPGAIPGLGGNVTPQQAQQVSPQQVQQAAAQAEQRNPSIVDDVSHFYAAHPDVVKALGGLALSIAIQHIARRR